MTTRDVKDFSTSLDKACRRRATTPEERRPLLRNWLDAGANLRLLEAHSGLTGLIVERAAAWRGTQRVQFDGIWFSSLTNSAIKGHSDNEIVDLTARLQTLDDLLDVTTKPIIYDADTGGSPEHLAATVRTLERQGVSALIVEDKAGPKRNSLSHAVTQVLEDVGTFCLKIRTARASRLTEGFMVIARVESLIVGAGMQDALMRAQAYVAAGADGVMIHSRASTADEVLEACRCFHRDHPGVPLVAVPSTYPHVSEDELTGAGVRIVIYANQLLRSAYPAMSAVARSILEHGRALEAESMCMMIENLLFLIDHGGDEALSEAEP